MLKLFDFPSNLVHDMRFVTAGLFVGALVNIPASICGVLLPRFETKALAVQALGVSLAAFSLLGWAVSLLINGLPHAVGFSWSPGVLTFACAYAAYVIRRSLLERKLGSSPAAFYLHFWTAAAVLPIDLALVVRVIHDFLFRQSAA